MKLLVAPASDPWTLLKHMVGEPLPAVERTDKGKPFFPRRPDLRFSLSHSHGWALCGVDTAPLGADIETVRPRRPAFPRQVLSPDEYRWFSARGEKWEDFYTLWTLKEAKGKCLGRGLTLPVRDMAVPLLEPGQTAVLDGLTFTAYGGSGWRAALAGQSAAPLDWYQPNGGAPC